MPNSICAFKTRNIRYIVDGQALKVQHLAQQTCNRPATFGQQGRLVPS
jgi:hypothetical protein